jgi:hypothetical protein
VTDAIDPSLLVAPPPIVETVLRPGPHLVEVVLGRPAPRATILRALGSAAMGGWSDGDGGPPILDESQHDRLIPFEAPDDVVRRRVSELLAGYEEWTDRGALPGMRVRFVAELAAPIAFVDTDDLRWILARPFAFDPFKDITKTIRPFPLETDVAYDVRFISRMKAQPTRSSVLAVLAAMEWQPIHLACLKKNMRLEGRPGVDCAIWCGAAIWRGPRTVQTSNELMTFEDVVPLPPEVQALYARAPYQLVGPSADQLVGSSASRLESGAAPAYEPVDLPAEEPAS